MCYTLCPYQTMYNDCAHTLLLIYSERPNKEVRIALHTKKVPRKEKKSNKTDTYMQLQSGNSS